MWKIIIFFFSLAIINDVDAAFWSNCTHTNAPGPDLIESPQCDDQRCFAVRGDHVFAEILATPQGAHVELLTRVTVFIMGIGVPIPVDPPYDNACHNIFKNGQVAHCPTVPFEQYLLEVEMQIPMSVPPFQNAIVRVEFLDRGQIAACGEVLATIV